MKKILKAMSLAIMLVLLGPGMIDAQSGKPDFSGTWALNAEKSNFGGGQGGVRGFGGGDMKVTQDGNNMTVATTRQGRNGGDPVTMTTTYTLDGKENVNTTQRGESKSTATWSPDGKALNIKTAQTFGDRTMNSTQVWTLDGSNLTVKRTFSTPNGDMTSTMVYDKK